MTFRHIKTERIIKMYTEQGMTMKEIGNKLSISHWTVLDRLKKAGVRKNARHNINHQAFRVVNSQSSYWAGFIAADGCINKNRVDIELAKHDEVHLKKLCDFVGRDDKLWYREKYGKHSASVSLVSKQIVSDLYDNFGITTSKSLTLCPPQISDNMVSHYIRGYMDGDGCIDIHKSSNSVRLSFVCGSIRLLDWLKDTIIDNVDLSGNPNIRQRKQNCYSLEFKNKHTLDILDWIYKGSVPSMRLDRKYLIYQDPIRRIN